MVGYWGQHSLYLTDREPNKRTMNHFIEYFQQGLFLAAVALVAFLVAGRARSITRNIKLGKPVEVSGESGRLGRMLLFAFGQKKMFDRVGLGLLHLVIYLGFILINIEIMEIVLDGMMGTHRIFAPYLGSFYYTLINFFEVLALGVLLACAVFLARRTFLRVPRFQKPEMKGWASIDASTILVAEIVLMCLLLTMNASDSVLQTRTDARFVMDHYGHGDHHRFLVSQALIPILELLPTLPLYLIERAAWWGHILGIFSFAIYVTYSKHLHIFMAFPTTYYSDPEPKGHMRNMEAVTQEVKIMLSGEMPPEEEGEPERFGAKDVTDLTWKNLMDAYSCTECGRCTDACPANQTGKKLSPRKVMMDVRDRLEEVGKKLDKNGTPTDDAKSLYGDYTTKEELMACTTCNACVEACPININPLDIILQQRRYIAMEESGTPASWNAAFNNIENNGAPWAFPQTDRFKYAQDIQDSE